MAVPVESPAVDSPVAPAFLEIPALAHVGRDEPEEPASALSDLFPNVACWVLEYRSEAFEAVVDMYNAALPLCDRAFAVWANAVEFNDVLAGR